MAKLDQNTLIGGEVGPQLLTRRDTSKYQAGVRRMRNWLMTTSGAAYTRPGTELCAEARNDDEEVVVIPFQANPQQGYALEFSDNRMRVYYKGGLVLEPYVTITNITQASPAVVTMPNHNALVNKLLRFDGVEGMTQINGLVVRVLNVINGDSFEIDLDTTGFSAFTTDTGGVPGNDDGGVGGQPPPPAPGAPVPPIEDTEPPPPVLPPWKLDTTYDEGNL